MASRLPTRPGVSARKARICSRLGKGRSCPGGAGLVFGFLRAVFMQQAKSWKFFGSLRRAPGFQKRTLRGVGGVAAQNTKASASF
jgi:hypothetical protein